MASSVPEEEISDKSRISIDFQTRKQATESTIQKRKKSLKDAEDRELPEEPEPESPRRSEDASDIGKHHADVDHHTIPLVQLIKQLETSLEDGLSTKSAANKLVLDGPNIVTTKRTHIIIRILGYLITGFNVLLYVCAFFCWISWKPLGDPDPSPLNLGLAIILIIVALISSFFTWFQEHKSSLVMKSIRKLLPQDVTVVRDGVMFTEKAINLVCGDVVAFKGGDRVPADCRLFKVQGLKIDQSILTGESEPVTKLEKCTDENYLHTKNIAFMGTNIIEGNSLGIVVSVGNNTIMGSITLSASRASVAPTYLQLQVRRLIIIFAILMAITGTVVILDWAFYLRPDHPGFENVPNLIINCIGVMVSYIPEGLPACLVLALTVVAKSMYKKSVLVKRLPIMETLGSVDIIASDKTGTLTQNLMSVSTLYLGGIKLSVGLKKSDKLVEELQTKKFQKLVRYMAMCNGARFNENSADDEDIDGGKKISGDATDTAFLRYASDAFDVKKLREKYEKLADIPFNSKNKWMLTVHDLGGSDKKECLLLMKGASEIILKKSTQVMVADGSTKKMDKKERQKIKAAMEALAEGGERVLGICKKKVPVSKDWPVYDDGFITDDYEIPNDGMTFVGLVSLIDPPRPDVPAAITALHTAGIRVIMVTGDHPKTATAIGEQVGIVTKEKRLVREVKVDTVMELILEEQNADEEFALIIPGSEIPGMTDLVWRWVFDHKEIVFARTSPENKLTIVKSAQSFGHIVGVTGDGVNDAPALKQADCGIAMGAGSDVARDAADLVLVTNSFSSILTGVENGRLVFDNLTKVILYVFPAGQFSEIIPVLVYSFFGIPLPLSSYLMIYICCITDVSPALSLTQETGETDLMKRKPRSPNLQLVRASTFLLSFGFFGLIECICAHVMFFVYYQNYCGMSPSDLLWAFDNYTEGFMNKTQTELNNCNNTGQTVYFVALVVCQFFNLMSTRTQRKSFFQHNPFFGPGQNRYLFVAIFISLCFALFTVYVPFMNDIFQTAPVPVEYWFLPMIFGVLLFMLDELRKFILRSWIHYSSKHGSGLAAMKAELKSVAICCN